MKIRKSSSISCCYKTRNKIKDPLKLSKTCTAKKELCLPSSPYTNLWLLNHHGIKNGNNSWVSLTTNLKSSLGADGTCKCCFTTTVHLRLKKKVSFSCRFMYGVCVIKAMALEQSGPYSKLQKFLLRISTFNVQIVFIN